jgi:hypothetical protein
MGSDNVNRLRLIFHNGRDICCEVAFSPVDDFFDDLRDVGSGRHRGGYGWLDFIESRLTKRSPDLLERLNCLDELATCVIWVESEAARRELIETI